MSRFIERWFGDHCPPWTWPLLTLAICVLVKWWPDRQETFEMIARWVQ